MRQFSVIDEVRSSETVSLWRRRAIDWVWRRGTRWTVDDSHESHETDETAGRERACGNAANSQGVDYQTQTAALLQRGL